MVFSVKFSTQLYDSDLVFIETKWETTHIIILQPDEAGSDDQQDGDYKLYANQNRTQFTTRRRESETPFQH